MKYCNTRHRIAEQRTKAITRHATTTLVHQSIHRLKSWDTKQVHVLVFIQGTLYSYSIMMHSLYAPSPCIIKATKKIRQSHAHLLRLFRSHNSMIQVAPVVVHVRSFSSKNREGSFTVNMPSPETKSWQRGAKLVKNTDTTSNKYLEHIRQTHDPALHLKTLEDELKGTMGPALGKQGEKVLNILNQMHEERRKVNALLTTCCSNMNLQDSESNLDVDVDACRC